MWGFPGGFLDQGEPHSAGLRRLFNQQLGIAIDSSLPLPEMEQSYTHFKVRLHPYVCGTASKRRKIRETRWVAVAKLDGFPMGKLDRQLAGIIRRNAL
jgi:A/G-specific adenine glycosylase